ncbi:hypothetical protein BDP27DRAFT_376870 [Rhodocollybia butyracea]|uniref:Uncharacterized protein n=1 Tax=Rhodocollybia butyracea TaxID=206335 RepID=A0A9P5PDG0_9AGAR|nr:hypothetical protein BDP27DRAFT_376870 [Rhodocollybia butyracea]
MLHAVTQQQPFDLSPQSDDPLNSSSLWAPPLDEASITCSSVLVESFPENPQHPPHPCAPSPRSHSRRLAPSPKSSHSRSPAGPALPASLALPARSVPRLPIPALPKISLCQAIDTPTRSTATVLVCCNNSVVTPIEDAGQDCAVSTHDDTGKLSHFAVTCRAPTSLLSS